jgi:hypothetical protein
MSRIFEDWIDQREAEVFDAAGWNPLHSFVDELDLYAERPEGWPSIFGEEVYRQPRGAGFEQATVSYRPLRVGPPGRTYGLKVAGDSVYVDINPSSVERPDNLFGFRFDDAVSRISDLLARHGCRGRVNWKLRRLDLTANVVTGSPRNREVFLQQLRYLEFPHCEKHLAKYGSVSWHNDAKRLTVYDKAKEIRHKYRNKVSDIDISWLRCDKGDDDYAEALAAECDRLGVVRVELKLKKQGLVSRGLRDLCDVTQERLDEVFMKEVEPLKKVVLENGAELTDAELGCLAKWMQGLFDREDYAKNTFYKYRNNIREATGYDIASPGPVSLERRREKFRTFTIGPDSFPGYVMPKVEDLA